MNQIKQMCNCRCHTEYVYESFGKGDDSPAVKKMLRESMRCTMCNHLPSTLGQPKPKVSRRGFISMLGSALVVAAAPEIVQMPFRIVSQIDLEERGAAYRRALEASLEQTYYRAYERVMHSWVDVRAFETVNGVVRLKATPIADEQIYNLGGDSKGEDHGSSSKT